MAVKSKALVATMVQSELLEKAKVLIAPKLSTNLRPSTHTSASAKTIAAVEAGDIQSIIDSLSAKQRLFCEEYLKDMDAGAAILRAKYNTKFSHQMGSELLKKPAIRIVINALRDQRSASSSVTKDYVLKKIVRTVELSEADGNHQSTLRGLELLAKHLGMFIERTEISGPDGEAIRYEKTVEDASKLESAIASLSKRTGTDGMVVVPFARPKSTP